MNENSNIPSVSIGTFVEIVKRQLAEENYRPIFGLGKGGIGKTESIMHLAKQELSIGYTDIRLLLYTETDLKGIPYPNENNTKTIWLQNNILPTAEKDGERGILVLDEITSANKSVRTAAYQLLNERKLGEYNLPDKWLVVCLGNGEDDGGDYQGIEGNFANRCSVYNVVTTVDDWKEWAIKNNVNPLVTGYISFRPCDLHSYSEDTDEAILFASPRSWKAVSDILNNRKFDSKDEITRNRILANIGQKVGYGFWTYCNYNNQIVSPREILNGAMPKVDKLEIITLTIQGIVKIVNEEINKNSQVDANTLLHISNAVKWLFSLDTEYAVMGIKDLVKCNKNLMAKIMLSGEFKEMCPNLLEFVKKNNSIFV